MAKAGSKPKRRASTGQSSAGRPRSPKPTRPKSRIDAANLPTYAELSIRPLHVLVFLAPLLIAYEIGSLLYLSNPSTGVVETISARRMISTFFETFGAFGLYLPGVALATVLLIWHLLRRDPWTIHVPVMPLMLMEAVLWTLPLIVLAMILPRITQMAEVVTWPPHLASADIRSLGWQARLTISIGAGLYEELVFRVVAIAALHFVLVDLLGVRRNTGAVLSVIISALAFALYHDLRTVGGELDVPLALFLTVAGLYFGLIYIWRGFGIVVAVHALYDVVALVLAPGA